MMITINSDNNKMGMEIELTLLAALIIVFIASFCGLLQKIRQTYENERILAEQNAAAAAANPSQASDGNFSLVYVNPTFPVTSEVSSGETGVFPAAPPPYSEFYQDPPPKYEDVIKAQAFSSPA